MEKELNIILQLVKLNLKENLEMDKKMEKEKNMIKVNWYLKENI